MIFILGWPEWAQEFQVRKLQPMSYQVRKLQPMSYQVRKLQPMSYLAERAYS